MTSDENNGHHTEQADSPAIGKPLDLGRKSLKSRQSRTKSLLRKQAGARKPKSYQNQKHVDLMAFNAGAECAFVNLVQELLEEEEHKGRNSIPIAEVIREGAYDLKVSPQTVKRYLMKYSARKAPFRVFGDQVLLNPNYQPDEEEEEEETHEDRN